MGAFADKTACDPLVRVKSRRRLDISLQALLPGNAAGIHYEEGRRRNAGVRPEFIVVSVDRLDERWVDVVGKSGYFVRWNTLVKQVSSHPFADHADRCRPSISPF